MKINSSVFKRRKISIGSFFKKTYIYIILAMIYIPLIIIILLSFNGQTDRGNVNVNFGVPTVVNYLKLFENNEFVNGLLNSLIVLIVVVPVSVFIATITCFGIWNTRQKSKMKSFVLSTSKFSIANPDAITGISLSLLFTSTWVALGFDLGLFTVILAHISFCIPYALITIYPKMSKMNYNLVLGSYDLGYSKLKTFFKIVLPYLMPAILGAVAITMAMSLDDFIITNLVNGSQQTISTAIYTTRKGIKAWVVTFGALIIIVTMIVIIVFAVYKYSRAKNRNLKALKE